MGEGPDEGISHRQFYLVLFQPAGDNALFSIVMATLAWPVFLDFPGNYQDELSVWRVVDGGEIDPLLFDILPAFDSAQGVGFMHVARRRGRSHGFVQEDGDIFHTVKGFYKYMSPA